MFKEIEQNYNITLPDIDPKYDSDGNIKNEKEIKAQLKKLFIIMTGVWLVNRKIIDSYSEKVMISEYLAIVSLVKKKGIRATLVTRQDWNTIIRQTMLKRAKNVQIKQVISGNAKRLNKRLQQTVESMYKQGKSKPQIAKALQKELGYNKNKAKSIATTEINYYKSEAQLEATKGLDVKKTWVYNYRAKEPRESHLAADGQTVIGRDNYFTVGGIKTKAPQHFGMADQDINCHCTMRIEPIERGNE
jgi:hypothetical protein